MSFSVRVSVWLSSTPLVVTSTVASLEDSSIFKYAPHENASVVIALIVGAVLSIVTEVLSVVLDVVEVFPAKSSNVIVNVITPSESEPLTV